METTERKTLSYPLSLMEVKKEISNRIDDFLLENEITIADKIKTLESDSLQVLGKAALQEEQNFDEVSEKVDVIFNNMRYKVMAKIMSDGDLTEAQKEIKLQESLLDIYQLQNSVEEMILRISIQLEDMNNDTKSYLQKSTDVGREFVSNITTLTSSIFK
ncbi:hypothetical protein KMW28_01480 [Flammeovirga yaeyamensis]|uniref:Phosphate transport regulator n=1 Tax=Flammeovirga yaeyamensis TaxID=367791 RepID=A0AAX1N444_9BACT|nr:hypothetical protein [Flammeovirga yaeyamensis]MBB3699757.1 hypothetical protein [Flammeovirga yaeyamensis]NMF36674.1 hypothetical protein [Flammeovirga yaeyamensis]QWG02281.1 hypothetical protein KMW28_01480 [Flammeovirga yaeyamensis]